jgi:hypothetical protein
VLLIALTIAALAAAAGGPAVPAQAPTPVATPSPTPSPTPTSTDVRKAATQAGFRGIARKLEKAQRPVVLFHPAKPGKMPAARGTSRLGGAPDLPVGTAWPRCKGKAQTFLGQVRLRDVPAGELRRLGGKLLFFTFVETDPSEPAYGEWAGACNAVLHAPEGVPLVRAEQIATFHMRSEAVTFSTRPDVPDLAEAGNHLMPPLRNVKMPDWERYYDFRNALNGVPESEHRLLGYPHAPNGGNACWERAERSQNTWRHLFTMGLDDAIGFDVGDAGTLQFLIAPKDLQSGQFGRVCGVFESF